MTDTGKSELLSRPTIPSSQYQMPHARDSHSPHLERTLQLYDDSLLRQVAAKLIKTRNQWPAAEMVKRCRTAFDNVAVIDLRLSDLPLPVRRLVALIGLSGTH